MNKVIFVIGSITAVVVGGLFFCAGLFARAKINPTSSEQSQSVQIVEKLKEKIDNIFEKKDENKIEIFDTDNDPKMVDEDDLTPLQNTSSGVLLEKPSVNITVDNLLNEVIATHNTADDCLFDNVKTQTEEVVVKNESKQNVVFIGYFPSETAHEISKLLMVKGYPAHVQTSNINDSESFIFCGPFKKESSAQALVDWLQQHNFSNAKIIEQTEIQPEEVNKNILKQQDKSLPTLNQGSAKPQDVSNNIEEETENFSEDVTEEMSTKAASKLVENPNFSDESEEVVPEKSADSLELED